jgi:hypothetical protein
MDQVLYIGRSGGTEKGVEPLLNRYFPGLQASHLRGLDEIGRFEPEGAVRGIVAEIEETDRIEPLLDLRTVFPASGLVLLGSTDSPRLIALSKRVRADAVHSVRGPLEERVRAAAGAMNGKAQLARSFSGTLADITIADLVQLRCLTRKSSLLEVTHGQETGSICFDRGEVVDAQAPGLRGPEAFNRLIAWEHGHFRELPYEVPAQRTVHQQWEMLLLEAVRLMDEAKSGGRTA